MDVVYVVRRGDVNDELRWSLRSIAANLPHDQVWIVGHQPAWVDGVEWVQTRQSMASKNRNSTLNVRTACKTAAISDPFLLVNDDMFVMAPHPGGIPILNRGRVADVLADYETRYTRRSSYVNGMRETARVLAGAGFVDPWSFELHVPLEVHKGPMLAALNLGSGVPVWHKRTAYGAFAGLEGETVHDVKVCRAHPAFDPDAPLLSTDDVTFKERPVGELIRSRFPDPCRYERGGR